MPDPAPAVSEVVLPVPSQKDDTQFVSGPWSPAVALKKVSWGLGKLGVSVSMAPSLAPAAAAAIQKVSAITTPYGVSISVNQVIFEKALPFLIFAALATGLDYAKVKTKLPWL